MKITHAKDDTKITHYEEGVELEPNSFYLDAAGALVVSNLYGNPVAAFYEGEVYGEGDIEYPLIDTKIKKLTLEV